MTNQSSQNLDTILFRLNQIGRAINRGESGNLAKLEDTLRLIADSATEVVPGSSAVMYTYNPKNGVFDIDSRVASEQHEDSRPDDAPRIDGLGMRAVETKNRILSYEMPESQINPAKANQGAKAVACYPLMVADEILGALYVYLHEPRAFSELELLMLDNFVNLTAMTLATAQRITLAQREQERKERELRRIRRAGMLISSHTSFNDALDSILQMALEVTDAKYGIFRLVEKNGTHLIAHAVAGENLVKPATESLPIDRHSVMGTVAIEREPLIISDLIEEPWKEIYYPFDHELTMRSELAVPLIGASGRLEGVLNLESPQINAFTKQDRYIMQILATHAVAAIQEVRLLDALQEITALVLTESLQSVYQELVEKASDLLNVPCSLLWLREENHLVIQASSNAEMLGWRTDLEGSYTGQVLLKGAAAISLEARSDLPDNVKATSQCGPALVAPLFTPGDVVQSNGPVGALSIFYDVEGQHDFDQIDWDKNVLNILGDYATLAIQNSAHQEAIKAAQERHTVTEAFAAIGDIASNLLHRLNNKIGTIPVRIQGIQDKSRNALENDAYLSNHLSEIETSATEAIRIVRESLFHLRPIKFSPVAVRDSVETAITNAQLPEGIRIFHQGLGSLPLVHACNQRLPLVFENLLDNASRAMQGRGEITISGKVREDKVEIRVMDTGPGISSDLHERIFEFSYSSSSPEMRANLGFGLWWVKTLMARFGGKITVESDGSSGTTFILELPIAEVEK